MMMMRSETTTTTVLASAAAFGLGYWLCKRRMALQDEEGPSESTIRLMTRIAIQEKAINLSQGFPNEPPAEVMARHAAGALLAGESEETANRCAKELPRFERSKDVLNQYSFPFGAPFLRQKLAKYYKHWYNLDVEPETEVTVVCGATEGFAASLRALCKPGDVAVFFQPFHELYPSQVKIFYLTPRAVTLKANSEWTFDPVELDAKMKGAKVLLFNSPHNPTGKVFTTKELDFIAGLCRKYNVTAITDEIYEHIIFDGLKHETLFSILGRERAVLVNSISKTASATGWRIGWVLANEARTKKIRAVHDSLLAGCPTPLQFGVSALLEDHDPYFTAIPEAYEEKRHILVDALQRNGFDTGPLPKGAYYIFADYSKVEKLRGLAPVDAALYLTKTVKVACVPGDNFYLGHYPVTYVRFAFVRSLDLLHQAAQNLDSHFQT